MLSDPTQIVWATSRGTTFAAPTSTNIPFSRVGPGRFVSTTAPFSVDQQARLTIKANSKVGSASNGLVRIDMDKNVSPINGIPQGDKTIGVWIGFSADMQHFTKADIMDCMVAAVCGFQSNIDQLILGGT